MTAGKLRNLITFQERVTESDPLWGQVDSTWKNVCNAHAEILTLLAGESELNQGVQSSIRYRLKLRYVSNIKPTMRIQWGEKLLEITGIVNVMQRNRELIIDAVEWEDA